MTEPTATLASLELAARLDAILARAEELVRSAPVPSLEQRWAGDLTVRDLSYRIFRLGLAFADAMDFGRLRGSWLDERAPADLEDGPAIGRYAALVRARLGGWLDGASPGEYGRAIEVPSGRQSGHELLESIAGAAGRALEELEARVPVRIGQGPG